MGEPPASLMRVQSKVLQHVFVDLFLQLHSRRSVGADDRVGAEAGVGGDVSARIRDPNIARDPADTMMRAFNGCNRKPAQPCRA
jgi:hypothetical protein